jgi:hypothetical protein
MFIYGYVKSGSNIPKCNIRNLGSFSTVQHATKVIIDEIETQDLGYDLSYFIQPENCTPEKLQEFLSGHFHPDAEVIMFSIHEDLNEDSDELITYSVRYYGLTYSSSDELAIKAEMGGYKLRKRKDCEPVWKQLISKKRVSA